MWSVGVKKLLHTLSTFIIDSDDIWYKRYVQNAVQIWELIKNDAWEAVIFLQEQMNLYLHITCNAKACQTPLFTRILNISHSQTISIKHQVECTKILTTILTTGGCYVPTQAYRLCQASKTDCWRTRLDSNPSDQAHQTVPSHNTQCSLSHWQTYQWRLLYSVLLEDRDWHLNIKINSLI